MPLGLCQRRCTLNYKSDSENDFCWVDDYFSHIRPHFDVRKADDLLIILPNKAVKLNRTGLTVLRLLKDGRSIGEILKGIGDNAERKMDLFYFLCDFRSLMTGCLGEGQKRKAVQTVPHTGSFNLLPVLSEVAVTYRCNLKCAFCYAACGCQKKEGGDSEMSIRELLKIFKVIRKDAQVPSISFTGGEPLLRKDIVELVAGAKKAGLRVNLISNGTLLAGNDLAGRLHDAGLNSAQISIEGPTAETHDSLTGVSGSFEKTLKGISSLKDANIHVHTNTTVNSRNAEHLVDLVKFVAKIGMARMSMNMVIPAGSASGRELQISYSKIWSFVEPARNAARKLGVEFMWYSPTPMCIFNPLAEGLGNKSCAACDGLLSIAPNGDVLPCSSYSQPVGNLLRQPFEEVWNSTTSLFFRRKEYAPEECSGCGKFTACAGACPLYWTAVGTGELQGRREYAVA